MVTATDSFSNNNKNERYYFMNKDTKLFEFTRFWFGNQYTLNIDTSTIIALPPGFSSLDKFIEGRVAFQNRETLENVLGKIGLTDRFDLVLANYGISLNDTLWIKSETDNISWKEINPYNTDLSFDISWFFDQDYQLQKRRPEYSTGGNSPKCWVKKENDFYMIKCGTSKYYKTGLEPFSDIYCNQLEQELDMPYVRYDAHIIDYDEFDREYKQGAYLKTVCDWDIKPTERFASICRSFCSEDIWSVPAANLGYISYEALLDSKWGFQIAQQLLLDTLTLNPDRHLNNISFLLDANTWDIIGVAPCFDNNLALLPYYDDTIKETLVEYCELQNSKLGQTFSELAGMCFSRFPELRNNIVNLRHFEFGKVGGFNFKQDRLDMLSEVVNMQIKKILKL